MNDNAKKWVEALRSGEFAQTTGHLHKNGGYCCLGVACVLYGREHGYEFEERIFHDDEGGSYSDEWQYFMDHDELPPNEVVEWLGLASEDGVFSRTIESRRSLVVLNDEGRTFAEIADIIESEPEGLFAE